MIRWCGAEARAITTDELIVSQIVGERMDNTGRKEEVWWYARVIREVWVVCRSASHCDAYVTTYGRK